MYLRGVNIMNSDYNLKMTPEQISDKINISKKRWFNKGTTNCYAYALGLDIPELKICYHAYQPGVISQNFDLNNSELFSYETLINCINSDLDCLNIKAREIDPNEDIANDEWKISLFISNIVLNSPNLISDFHFLRNISENVWLHKFGYYGKIINFDDNDKIITNPKECNFSDLVYAKTLSLSRRK